MDKVKQVGTLLNEKKREAETMADTFERHSWIKGKEVNIVINVLVWRLLIINTLRLMSLLIVGLFAKILSLM